MTKRLFFLITGVAIVLFTVSCSTQNLEEVQKANMDLVTELYEHFNNHDWEKMAGLYTNPAEFKDPSLGKGIVPQTHKQTIKKYAELNGVFPNIHDEVVALYPSGANCVIAEFISTGTALDDSELELPISTIFTIKEGKIVSDFTYFDM